MTLKINFSRKNILLACIILIALFISFINSHENNEEEITETVNQTLITCGSSLRISNIMTKFNLYSSRLTWGSGSGMQMMASTKSNDDYDSLFIMKEGHGLEPCLTGMKIKCGSIIRLEHVNTGKNVHTHDFKSFITESQEACGFGENGYGDINDNWEIQCYNSKEEYLKGETQFFLFHVGTKKYLYINIRKSLYNDSNCRGCPIRGLREVSATATKDKQALWKVKGGIIFNAIEEEENKSTSD